MGDGGVACMPLQQHQHQPIMERCQVAEKTLCGGSSNGLSSMPVKLEEPQQQQPPLRKKKKVIKVKKVIVVKKKVVEKKLEPGLKQKSELVTKEKGELRIQNTKEIQNPGNSEQAEEVEEGELGTLKWPGEAEIGQVLPEKSIKIESERLRVPVFQECMKTELESGLLVSSSKNELLKGKIVCERKGESEKRDELVIGDSFMVKWNRAGKGEADKEEIRSRRGIRDEIEKGEFIPERWHRGNTTKGDYNSKVRKSVTGKEKVWKYEQGTTPPDGNYSGSDAYCRKEISRSAPQHPKSFARWETGHERTLKIVSKIVDEQGQRSSEYSQGKKHGKEYSSSNRLKRPGGDTESFDRKHHGDYGDYSSSKSRRLSDDNSRTIKVEHHSRLSSERSYRNHSLSRKSSSRHQEFSFSSKVHHDKHGCSPGYPERSPHDRARNYDYQDRSPVHGEKLPHVNRSSYTRDRSPHARDRSPNIHRDRSVYARERSRDRTHHHHHRHRSPTSAGQSPKDRARVHDRRDKTPYVERSPNDQSRHNSCQRNKRKNSTSEKLISNHSSERPDDQICQTAHGSVEKLNSMSREEHINLNETKEANDKNGTCELQKEEQSPSPNVICEGYPHVDGAPPEELQSMEEDMDICDTPPHNSVVAESSLGKWIYLDYLGFECGPSKLCEVKSLVEEGALSSDHFIKHLDSDRWVTVENAASPLVTANFPSIASDCVTQLVSPPEAPGNILVESGDQVQGDVRSNAEMAVSNGSVVLSEPLGDLLIDERIEALLEGYVLVPGKELETIGEVLCMTFDKNEQMEWGNCEDFACFGDFCTKRIEEPSGYSELNSKDITAFRLSTSSDGFTCADIGDWFCSRWASKGGDWKRSDDVAHDRDLKKKLVLNDGFPLCQMAKSGYEDPRWQQKDDLYFPSHSKRLDLPPWAFFILEERNDCNNLCRSGQTKAPVPRSTKGTVLPVVRINACVVQDHGSFVSESRTTARGKDKYSSRTSRSRSASSDFKRSLAESNSQSKTANDKELQSSWNCIASIRTPNDRVGTVDDLQLHLGEWFYLDGAGHEQGPLMFAELQALENQGIIQKNSSVFRKFDKMWVPISSEIEAFKSKTRVENPARYSDSSGPSHPQVEPTAASDSEMKFNIHSIHPQFIGYIRGKLHELVMKSYKSREFTAAIREVLDPWINAKQPKKDVEKLSFRKSEGDAHAAKRARLMVEAVVDGYEMEEMQSSIIDDSTFEDLCGDARFYEEKVASSESESGGWALLDGHVLARIFHFLKSDLRSLSFASLTCKHWRAAVKFYKGISKQVDLSSMGSSCVDSMMWSIMNGYSKEKIKSVVLMGCTSITPSTFEEMLYVFPSICSLDVRGCNHFGNVVLKFPHIDWLKSRRLPSSEESSGSIRCLNQTKEPISSVSKKGLSGNVDEYGELKDYFERDSSFRRSLYRRSKVFDARKSSSISSRDARIRRWAMKKSENEYKRIEQFLASSLRDIMKENAFEFFVPKVAEIEERMKNGYYAGHGLNSVKEDISRMCRDAIKAKGRGGGTDMNHIITLFIQLATRLEQAARITSSYERDELMRSWRDGNPTAISKYKKKYGKLGNERKYTNRSNGSSFSNGTINDGEYASDREIRRRLSKLNRKSMGSESETSDDLDQSSEEGKSNASTSSDTQSDLDFGSTIESRGGYSAVDNDFESTTDDREWGARMTKASLVPPVTRKYEVIDQYVVVADEENVQRKMRVSLPEDYVEKLNAQKSGSEELDMELPEVKDYKPRKSLGDEVIEQEVYGIDPYTHNLLLDSMPEELNWPLLDKHLFIEDVLLQTLNKQVWQFTGTGNTPMIYPLQPVIEEIKRVAEEDCDIRTMRMCQGLVRAIEARPDDNYVAYRKGLGVVCNKERGFGEEDFVVEFLGEVYPVWKWFEKQDGIRSFQKNNKDAPEFYNIYLERPKGDAEGYDLVVVDAMHKANYASRICHSCRPNCEAKVTAVDGHYQIGIYTVRKIQYGEEITFDYNSVTESKEEYEASVCLCGSQVCRGSYLNLTGEGAFQKVLEEWHGILDRQRLMLEACELNSVSEEDYLDLGRAGFGSCLLGGLPDWLIAYSARLVRFINFERTKLPEEILRHNLEEKRKYFLDTCLEVEKSDAEIQAEGVYNQRLQNLAVTLDKVRYVLRCVFGDPKKAPPPLERLNHEEVLAYLWKGEGSPVQELLGSMAHHVEENLLNDLKAGILAHDPSGSSDIEKGLRKSLLWLRDEVRDLPCTYKCHNDAAADLIHVYAYTKCFFRIREYKAVTSPPVYISPLDLGPKYADKFVVPQEYRKTYGENYCLGQLIYWYNQTNADPDRSLFRASKGCLSLPEIGSFYAKVQKPLQNRVYGPKTVKFMLSRMEKQPQRAWPKDRIWSFRSCPKVFGSPMMDAVINNAPLDREMVQWLRYRPAIFQAMWDR